MTHFKLIADLSVDLLAAVIFASIIAEFAVSSIKRLIREWKKEDGQ